MAYIKKKKKEEAQKHFPPKCHYNPKHRGGIQASNSSTHHRQIHQSAFSPSKTIHTSLSLIFLTVVTAASSSQETFL